jgi:hypothetical protein
MHLKNVTIGARTTLANRLAVQVYAALQGKTVSQLIEERIIQKAVQPLRDAAAVVDGEVGDGLLSTHADE